MTKKSLHAAIGVCFSGDLTYYVKRSDKMENYPSVWSLFSIQFNPEKINSENLGHVQQLMDKMSYERLMGTPVSVIKRLTSGNSDRNPYGIDVHLYLYRIEFLTRPRLNPDYYTDAAWLTDEEYEIKTADMACGLCTKLWANYTWRTNNY